MRVEPLAQFLEDQGVGTLATNIFVNFIPDEIAVGLMIHSGLMQTKIDAELPGYRAGASFQIVVRAQQYEPGYALIQAAMDAITTEQRLQLGNMLFNFIRPKHEPVVYPLSTGNLIELSVNFDCNYVIV